MAASNVTVEVQEYLDKHKINTLFEDLRTKLTKDLPSDPLSYLINALRAIQDKKKRVLSSRAPVGRVEVAGKSVKPVDRLVKSTDNVRPSSGQPTTTKRSALQSASSPSVSSRKPITPGTPATSKTTAGSTAKVTSRTPRVTPASPRTTLRTSKVTTTTPTSKSSTSTRPSTAPTTTATKSPRIAKTPSTSSTSKISKPSSAISKTSPTKPTKQANGATKRPSKPAAVATKQSSKETIDEFFGEKKKSSSQQVFVSEQEEMAELGKEKEQPIREDDTEATTAVADDSDDNKKAPADEKDICDLYEDMKKNKSGNKQPAIMRNEHLKTLQDMIVTEQVSGSHDNGDDSGSEVEEVVTLFEDTEVLKEDEGVESTSPVDGAKKTIKKQGKQPTLICARCARAMADSDIAAADAVQDDFESASQVASSQRNFPSWDASTSVTEQWSAVDSQKLAGNNDDDSTVITMTTTTTSEDEWAGLAQTRQPVDQSETESEVQVPQVPLTGKSWTPPAEESGDATAAQQWAT
ncbi:uncharacterized protein DDB_G0286299-like isoform X2 [Dysidea avara]|uniref:uncharacterized protein DDB_G0286299-like isoform X2 n=1 Tax=Dysidea avara TaxID=196820 RepID=UPI00331B1148